MAKNNDETTVLASNRRARHDYTILDVVEAGIVLHGSDDTPLQGPVTVLGPGTGLGVLSVMRLRT